MRPEDKPSKPYTNQQIVDNVWQHFIVEKNPRCILFNKNLCSYLKTGCAIGCLLTEEDAYFWEQNIGTLYDYEDSDLPQRYFEYFDKESYKLLCNLQNWHDNEKNNLDSLILKQIIQDHQLVLPN